MTMARTVFRWPSLCAVAARNFWLLQEVRADDLTFQCDDTIITLTCGDGEDAGNCTTTSASDDSWDVTCKGHMICGSHVQTICDNATDIGGTHV
ncbi:MAG: hypothetical protein CMM46_10980 [Rhodospirillaceae bacterium]|nr:hypothetical protein [Rhodospirillaceae bacterium]|tara:strand:+ start:4546 stop:4827 length:282 start_codon:yes stop_codon:yes gene_type:complete